MRADPPPNELFADRRHAGVELADRLRIRFAGSRNTMVLALPRGGAPVGHEVAQALSVPLDVFLVRKLGLPGHPELAMGAIASGGVKVINDDVFARYRVPQHALDEVVRMEQAELERRERAYRAGWPPLRCQGRAVILVDDGLATGSTMRAAVLAVRAHAPSRVVVAVPVGAAATCRELAKEADEIVCVRTPEELVAVGFWYRDFSQTTDDEVRRLLHGA